MPLEFLLVGVLVFFAVAGVVAVARLIGRRPTADRAEAFLLRAGLPVDDPASRTTTLAFLARQRQWRAAGILVGAVAGGVAQVPSGTVAGAMAGFLLGSLVAGSMDHLGAPSPSRVASLSPRVVADYVPRSSLVLLRVLAGCAVGVALAGAVLPPHEPRVISVPAWGWVTLAVVAAGHLVLAEGAARRVVTRAQAASSPHDVRLDDAIRSACARAVVAAGVGLGFVVLSTTAYVTGVAVDLQVLRWVLPVAAVLAFAAAPVAWASLARPQSWQVSRHTMALAPELP